MTGAILILAGTLLVSPESRPAIPDYFGDDAGRGSNAALSCNLSTQDLDGQFKTCRYDCGRTLTVGSGSVCPFVLQQ